MLARKVPLRCVITGKRSTTRKATSPTAAWVILTSCCVCKCYQRRKHKGLQYRWLGGGGAVVSGHCEPTGLSCSAAGQPVKTVT